LFEFKLLYICFAFRDKSLDTTIFSIKDLYTIERFKYHEHAIVFTP
jgi:hypothetical protein